MINDLISLLNSARYKLTEPVKLARARRRNDCLEYKPKISILLPTIGRKDMLIERSVPSVLAQTYINWELLIIYDDRESILWYPVDSRIFTTSNYSKHKPKDLKGRWLVGPAEALNYGLSCIHGSWIARIDDDDIWTPDHLEKLLRFAQQGNFEFVSANYVTKRYGEEVIDPSNDWKVPVGGTSTWLYRSYLKCFKWNVNCWRKRWNANNDVDLPLRMLNAGVRMGFLNDVVAKILPRPNDETIGWDAIKEGNKK